MLEKQSPFMPGSPVTPELFVGRVEELSRLERHVRQAFGQQRVECAFIMGERGIGKSSAAQMLTAQVEFDRNGYTVPLSEFAQFIKSLVDTLASADRIIRRLALKGRGGVGNFLRRMTELGVLQRSGSGEYRFANELYLLYAFMEEGAVKHQRGGESDDGRACRFGVKGSHPQHP